MTAPAEVHSKFLSTGTRYGVRFMRVPHAVERPEAAIARLRIISSWTIVQVLRYAAPIVALAFVTAACQGRRPPEPPQPPCVPVLGLYRVAPGATIAWMAEKNAGVPVLGEQAVSGTLEIDDGPLDVGKASLELVFGRAPSTENALRDERIEEVVFGGRAVTFALTRVATTPQGAALPKPGEGLAAVASGRLTMAGFISAVDVPLMLSTAADGAVRAMTTDDGIPLSLREGLGLTAQIAELEELSGVKIDDALRVMFDLVLVPACS